MVQDRTKSEIKDVGWPNGLHYHEDVEKAFGTASALATVLHPLTGEITVLAHSLGNMVVSSAIQDHGFRPDRFFMLNAAVPAEAFDATQWNTSTNLNPMLHEEWHEYPDFSWASLWYQLFGRNDLDELLAKGVPALSGPAGSRQIGEIPESRNINLNGTTGGSAWPRRNLPEWSGWRHGDVKAIALPFVYGVFADFCNRMGSTQ